MSVDSFSESRLVIAYDANTDICVSLSLFLNFTLVITVLNSYCKCSLKFFIIHLKVAFLLIDHFS